ncbi:hypothetical protein ebA800 [Aromatoleum aromaticum EbN1]|uniref:DUF1376 domain-containing protein n=1 Tax=Aromatoleum aromaticum (strain DSM 19018 / LMG 30748 / EbN1) TaxID=76114 RepID=Q5P819_AROAE|nr:DUF1376 domain-containing protein [Aromatoleum aromaticum]CAI06542.1 hypothetical protein ebA800 [Aromatoleum aromaticum EbN1]
MSKITPPLRLLVDIPAWQREVFNMPNPAAACGALLLLKMHLWRVGPIPDDNHTLTRITGTTPAEWKKLRRDIEPLFIVMHGEWQREDWNDELEQAYHAVNRASQAGKKANAARWGQCKKVSESESESDRNRSPNRIPDRILNNKENRNGQKPTPQAQKPKARAKASKFVSGDFEDDVRIAERDLGIGGEV